MLSVIGSSPLLLIVSFVVTRSLAITVPDAVHTVSLVARAAAADATPTAKAGKNASSSMLEGSIAGTKTYLIVIIVLTVLLALILGYFLYWYCLGSGEEYLDWKKSQKESSKPTSGNKKHNKNKQPALPLNNGGLALPSPFGQQAF